MTRRQPVEPVELVRISCAVDNCDASTAVVVAHADNLAGRWRCRQHYLGAFARPNDHPRP